MRRKLLTGSLLFWTSTIATVTWAGGRPEATLPKIGDRHYVVDQDRYAPVEIQKAANSTATKYLKDPIQPSKDGKVEVAKPVVKEKPKPVKVARVEKRGQLRFQKMTVSGHVNQPRVEFSRDLLPVDRADEPLPQDFYEKVFLPAKDDNF